MNIFTGGLSWKRSNKEKLSLNLLMKLLKDILKILSLSRKFLVIESKVLLNKMKKNFKGLDVQLIYKSSPEASFRLFKTLSLLIDEKDILKHFQKYSKKKVLKLKRPLGTPITTGQKND